MRRMITIIFVFLAAGICAQVPFFETYFGSGQPDYGRSLKQFPDSSIYFIGNTNDTLLFQNDTRLYKLAPDGSQRWVKNLGDSLDDNSLFILPSPDGKLFICGESHTANNHLDGVLMKVDTSGNMIWKKYYGGPLYESFNRMAITAEGKLVLTGFQTDAGGLNGIYVVCADTAGNELWSGNYGGSDNDIGVAVCPMPDSGFVIAGDTRRTGGDYDICCMRFSKTGVVTWDSAYAYNDTVADGAQGIILLSDGNLLVYGESPASGNSWFDFLLHKIDPNGNTIWFRKCGGNNPDAAFSILERPGGFIGTGYSTSFSPGPNNIIVFACDQSGNLLWAHPYGGPGIDIGYEIIPALGGGYYIGATGNVNTDDQCGLLHVDDAGWASVTETEDPLLAVYPNPAAGTIYIRTEMPGKSAALFSADGRTVLQFRLNETQTAIQTENLARGLYILRVDTGQGMITRKIVVN